MDEVKELDARAVAMSEQVVFRVGADDLEKPTPCAGWTLRDLLLHMAAQHRGFAAAARGGGADPQAWQPPAASGTDPVAAYPEVAADVLSAFAAADLETELTLPDFGDKSFPVSRAITFHFVDYLVHAWDVGASIGVDVRPDDDLLTPALDIAKAVPVGDARTARVPPSRRFSTGSAPTPTRGAGSCGCSAAIPTGVRSPDSQVIGR